LYSQPFHVEAVLQIIETLLHGIFAIDLQSLGRILDTGGKQPIENGIAANMPFDLLKPKNLLSAWFS